MTRAIPWDGVGPKDECLLRVVWKDSGTAEWIHFEWQDADGEPDGEGGWSYTYPGYINDASSISIHEGSDGWMGGSGKFDDIQGADFTITHWSPKPVVEDECDACHQLGGNHRPQCMNSIRRRIENDVEEGAVVG